MSIASAGDDDVSTVRNVTAKNEARLDHYQARDYRAWYAHITLAMLVVAYLAATRAQEAEKGDPRRTLTLKAMV